MSDRRFVERACHQALDAHETDNVDFHDALSTAERMYAHNWKIHRQERGRWSERDDARAARFTLPNGTARRLFDTDEDMQRLLASRDVRLATYRDALQHILETRVDATTPQFEPVLRAFLDFARARNPGAYPWRTSFGDLRCVFPGRDIWAFWLCLRDMWPSQNQ